VIKGIVEYPLRATALFNTDMGWYVAPAGTVTVRLVLLPAVTVAIVAPKKTILLAGVVLKFVPVMVTVVPIGPLPGLKVVMTGACENTFDAARTKNSIKYTCLK